VEELNRLKTDRSIMLIKITDLEEKLLEAQLQIERLTDEKLTHMPSVQKSPTNKTGLRYVASTLYPFYFQDCVCQAHSPRASTCLYG